MPRAKKIDYAARVAALESKRGSAFKEGLNTIRVLWPRVEDGELLGAKRMTHFVQGIDDKGNPRSVPYVCPNSFVPDGVRANKCPLCEFVFKHKDKGDTLYEATNGRNGVKASKKYAMNVIDRANGEVSVIEAPYSVYMDILRLAKEVQSEEGKDIFSPYASEGGTDITVNYDPKASPKDMYRVKLKRDYSDATPNFKGVDPNGDEAEKQKAAKLEAEVEAKMTMLSTYTPLESVASDEKLMEIIKDISGEGDGYQDPPELGYGGGGNTPASKLDLRGYDPEFVADNGELISTLENAAPSALIRECRSRGIKYTGLSNDDMVYAILDYESKEYNSVPFDTEEPAESVQERPKAASGYDAVTERLNQGTSRRAAAAPRRR